MKNITGIYSAPHGHWVGDGFPVRTLFDYNRMGAHHITPFLMLDYAGPCDFESTTRRRGVGAHPHRGFETVTIVYDGEVEHRDSSGAGGIIGKGDVQWMTAGNGIIHEERHSPTYAKRGGRFEMVQLWVNLRAADKTTPAAYQAIEANDIPRIELADGAGRLHPIAGTYADATGPAHTFSPMNVWDLRLNAHRATMLEIPEDHTAMVVVLSGTVRINADKVVRDAQFALFERSGVEVSLEASNDAKLLVLTGEPFDDPVVGHGPFVMNSAEEIEESIRGFQSGRLGQAS